MKKVKMITLNALCFMLIFMVSCDESTTQQAEEEEQQEETQQQGMQDSGDNQLTLKVIGNKVNLRDEPSTSGKLVGQVNDGETYEIFGTSEYFETIGKETDYWFQIDKDGQEGWIFGAFTSQNLNDNPRMFRGVFEGAEWGDYLYIDFRADDTGMGFGEGATFGHNNYGKYDAIGFEEEGEDKYVGKTFEITWKVLLSDAYAGEGSMDIVKREIPVIVDLKMVE